MRTILRWGLLIVLCVLVQGAIFGIGLLIGTIRGEYGSAHRRYLKEEGIMSTVIQADPAFTGIEFMEGCDGSLSLGGEVPTPADLARLQSQVTRALGEPRSLDVMRPVHVKK